MEVLADFTRLGADFQRGMNAALSGVTINMSSINNQITQSITNTVNQANRELARIGQGAGTGLSVLSAQASTVSRSMVDSFASAGRSIASVGEGMTKALTVPLVAMGTATIYAAGNFEQQMNSVKAVTQATGTEFSKMRDLAIQLGSTTKFSASEAALAMELLASAGFETTEIMTALPAVLDMAASGSVSLADAADVAAGVLNGFGFEAKDLAMVNDKLTQTFLSSATTLSDLRNSFKYAAPIAKSAGISFSETAAAIGLLGNAGIKGTMAGTGLNGAITRLLKPTGEVSAKLNELGISVTDSSGKMRSLTDIFRQLERSGADTADMITIFGLNSGPDMVALLGQGSYALEELTKKIEESGGVASQVATTKMQGFNGAMDELRSSAEALMIAIGDTGLLAGMTDLVKRITQVVMSMSKASPEILRMATTIGLVVAALGPMIIVIGKVVTMVALAIGYIQKFYKWMKSLSSVAYVWAALTGPLAILIWSLIALGVAAVVAYKKIQGFRDTVNRAVSSVVTAVKDLWSQVQVAFMAIGVWFDRLVVSAKNLWNRMLPVFAAIGAALMSVWRGIIIPAVKGIGNTFASLGRSISTLWSGTLRPPIMSIIGLFAQLGSAVGGWFSKNAGPAFRNAAAVISWFWTNAVRPALSAFMGFLKMLASAVVVVFNNIVVPAVKIAVAAIGEIWKTIVAMYQATKPVWDLLGSIISSVFTGIVNAVMWVVNAVSSAWPSIGSTISSTWNFISPVFDFIKSAFELVGTVAMWLWQNVFVPAFAGIRVVIGWIGSAITIAFSVVRTAIQVVGSIVMWLWQNVFAPAFGAIAAIVGAAISVFMWFWNTFGPLVMAIGKLVWAVFSGVIQVAFALLKVGFMAVAAVFLLAWAIIKPVITLLGTVIMWVWNSFIKPAFDLFMSAMAILWAFASPFVSAVGGFFSSLGGVISSVVSSIVGFFSGLASSISGIFSGIIGFIKGAVATIVAAAYGISTFVSISVGYFTGFVNSVTEKVNAVTSYISGLPGKITSAIGNLGNLLYNAGRSIIQGLINGIDSMMGALADKISSAASTVRDFFPFSPAKRGPLSGAGSPELSGAKIISMVADGMEKQIPDLKAITGDVMMAAQLGVETTRIPALSSVAVQPVPVSASAGVGGNSYYLTVNALDPKAASRSVMEAINQWENDNGSNWRRK